MSAYYNENDPKAAAWLRELIKEGRIAPGDVDERSIKEVQPEDVRSYTQCHFFAGIGVWSYALRLAGWPDSRPVWTGSCPCQSFSAAGKQEGFSDPRHLWPEWFRLIKECRPVTIFGEQVGAAIRHGWLDLVQADLEGIDNAFGSAVVGAHSVGAPHIRQRVYFVADNHGSRRRERRSGEAGDGRVEARVEPSGLRDVGILVHSLSAGWTERGSESGNGSTSRCSGVSELVYSESEQVGISRCARESGSTDNGRTLGNTDYQGPQGYGRPVTEYDEAGREASERHERTLGFWDDADWLPCIDGKARPVRPGSFPLAHGAPCRVGRLRGYGNAIVAQVAQAFIEAYMSIEQEGV